MSTKVCLNCLKEAEIDLRCTKCKVGIYCQKNCQVAHWPTHKSICKEIVKLKTKICLNCLKEVGGHMKCSKCRVAVYCNDECQIAHWPVHESMCQDSNSEDSNEKLKMKAMNHFKQGNYNKAEKLYSKLLGILKSTLAIGDNHPTTLITMQNLAATYCSLGKYAEAEALYKQCFGNQKVVFVPTLINELFLLVGRLFSLVGRLFSLVGGLFSLVGKVIFTRESYFY